MRTLAGLAVSSTLVLAGCQSAAGPSAYAQTLPGGHAALAGCFAQGKDDATIVVSDAPTDRTISVDVNAYRDDGYRIAFAPVSGGTTRVSGARRGPAAAPLFWTDEVLPALARCAAQSRE